MKDIRLIILFLFSTISCFPQKTILIDTAIIKNSTFKPLRDCQKFHNYRPEDPLCAELIRSYYFDDNLNISGVLYSHVGRDADTSLSIMSYDKKNNLINRTNHSKYMKRDTLVEMSKVLYLYNSKGLLEKQIGLSQVEKTQLYDTMFVIEKTFNSNGLLEKENTRNVEPNYFMTTGYKKYLYDDSDRIKEIQFIANCCRLVDDKSVDNYNVYYTYSGDSSYKETQVFNFVNKGNNQYGEWAYSKDKTGRITKIVESNVYPVEVLFVNGKYFPDPNSKTARFENKTIIYTYDKLGRIEKCTYNCNSDDRRDGCKTKYEYVEFFKYKDNKLYKLPTGEYTDDE
ncbi:MAG: hypothetical protein A3F72_16125 [Bacteroidetes bacterium RIFCSPLOWO2_12_FULL_35_15]|nr:MAG: hypothetical protein A3F72_16125 [Bacteroidetes bacterium RIFCSPLOWO2_12_FULL_35_15]